MLVGAHTFLNKKNSILISLTDANLIHVARAWEELITVFVERYSHHPVGIVKRFLDPIPMVNILTM